MLCVLFIFSQALVAWGGHMEVSEDLYIYANYEVLSM